MKLNNKRSLLATVTSKISSLDPQKRGAVFLVAFALVGAIVVIVSQAAVSTFGLETENGSLSGNVSVINDVLSSAGKHLKFGQQPYTDLFVSNSGSDSKNGTTEANAVKTISKAVQLAGDHTRIRIMAGTYIETVRVQKNNLIIEPYGNGDVTVIGAIPELIQGVSWINVQSGIYKAYIDREENHPDGNPIYTSDGKQQWSYPDLIQLQSRFTVNNLPGVYINNFILDRAVYVATNNGQPPSAPLYVGGARATIDIINASNISINGVGNSKLKLAYGTMNVQLRNSSNIKITNVNIIGGSAAINSFDSSNIIIKNNTLRGEFERSWDYSDVKERPNTKTMENAAIHVKTISKDIKNIVVDNNDVSGYWAAIYFATNARGPNDTVMYNDDSVISNNLVHDIGGPGIETEAHFRNLIVRSNKVYDTYDPFSPVPAVVGPIYVYENLLIANREIPSEFGAGSRGPGYSIKMNSDQFAIPDNIHYYHNTFYFSGNPNSGNTSKTVESRPDYITKNMSFINNIFYSYGGGIIRGSGRAEDNIEWDGNVFYSEVNDPKNYFAWNTFYGEGNSYPSLSSIINSGKMPSQWQGNVEGNPGFNCVLPTNNSCFRSSSSITKPSFLQPIPGSYPDSARLNSRTRVGAFE